MPAATLPVVAGTVEPIVITAPDGITVEVVRRKTDRSTTPPTLTVNHSQRIMLNGKLVD